MDFINSYNSYSGVSVFLLDFFSLTKSLLMQLMDILKISPLKRNDCGKIKTLKTCTVQCTPPFERHILITAIQLRNFLGFAGRLVYLILF